MSSAVSPSPLSGSLLVTDTSERCYVILNLYPYNNGHLMVVPARHVPSLAGCSHEEEAEMMDLSRRAELALLEAYHPQGINVGINIGRAAGAGVVDHVPARGGGPWSLVEVWACAFGKLVAEGQEVAETLGGQRVDAPPVEHPILVGHQIAQARCRGQARGQLLR